MAEWGQATSQVGSRTCQHYPCGIENMVNARVTGRRKLPTTVQKARLGIAVSDSLEGGPEKLLWKRSLIRNEDPRMLEIPGPQFVHWQKLQTQSGARDRKTERAGCLICWSQMILTNQSSRCQTWSMGFEVCPDEFRFCFVLVFPCYIPVPLFWNKNVCFTPLNSEVGKV